MVASLLHQWATEMPNDRRSSYLYNNEDFLQGAVLSRFSLFLAHWLVLTSCHVKQQILRLRWAGQQPLSSCNHGLVINRTKCFKCFFYSKTLPLYYRSLYLMVKLYPVCTLSNISVYVSPLTWLGLLMVTLPSQNALYYLFYSQVPFHERPKISFRVNRISLHHPRNLILLLEHLPSTA